MFASDRIWSRRRVRRGMAAAAVLCSLGLGAFGLHRVWAAEPAAAKAGDPSVAAVWRTRTILADPEHGSNRRGTVGYAMVAPDARTTQIEL